MPDLTGTSMMVREEMNPKQKPPVKQRTTFFFAPGKIENENTAGRKP
jgi:hypothetical protein